MNNGTADIFFIVVYMFAMAYAMKHHGTWKPVDGLGGFLGWFFLSFILFGITKAAMIITWLKLSGQALSFPVAASNECHIISSILAIAVWFAMLYWQIPGRIYRAIRGQ